MADKLRSARDVAESLRTCICIGNGSGHSRMCEQAVERATAAILDAYKAGAEWMRERAKAAARGASVVVGATGSYSPPLLSIDANIDAIDVGEMNDGT